MLTFEMAYYQSRYFLELSHRISIVDAWPWISCRNDNSYRHRIIEMKRASSTWMAQFQHLAKNAGLNTDNMEDEKTLFVYRDSGSSPESAVEKELKLQEKTQ